MREVRSWVSDENWDAEACELRERLLAEGERTFGCGDGAEGGRAFAEPRTRPPPRVLRDMVEVTGGAWKVTREG